MAPAIPIQPSIIESYHAAPGLVNSGYASGTSQLDPYPHSPRGVGGYSQPRDPIDPIPHRVVSPESDGGRYELGGHAGRGQPPTYLSQGKT